MFLNILIAVLIFYFIVSIYSHIYSKHKTLMILVKALEEMSYWYDEDTGTHMKRIKEYSFFLAKKYGCSSKAAKEIYFFASLHDIGKIGVPFELLKKKDKLENEEFKKIKNHSLIGFNIIKTLNIGAVAANITKYHHEKWDGEGYPEGLKGKNIPLEARIVAIADVYDALRQARSYKPSFSHQKAVEIISSNKDTHFDPKLVEIFLQNNIKFKKIFDRYDERK